VVDRATYHVCETNRHGFSEICASDIYFHRHGHQLCLLGSEEVREMGHIHHAIPQHSMWPIRLAVLPAFPPIHLIMTLRNDFSSLQYTGSYNSAHYEMKTRNVCWPFGKANQGNGTSCKQDKDRCKAGDRAGLQDGQHGVSLDIL
jgi:hypothetical protein